MDVAPLQGNRDALRSFIGILEAEACHLDCSYDEFMGVLPRLE